jgi:hypothetical protein
MIFTWNEAKNKVAAIAAGKYYSLDYGESYNNTYGRPMVPMCTLYIDSIGAAIGETWDEAFVKLENRINPPVCDQGPE